MNVPKWPVELPQTYDIVSETTYERDMIENPTRTSAKNSNPGFDGAANFAP
jgi:hypothetical protein